AWDFKGAKNRDWTPFVTTFPDWPIPEMAFCLVPVGSFTMGSDTDYDREKPAHRQTIQRPYWIAQTPVTNRQWRAAVKAGWVSDPPDQSSWGSDIGQWYHDPAMADCPVVGISWFAALEFCQAIACHLPNERDWEYAARGVESWIYPWGDDWEQGDKAVCRGNSGGKPNPVTHKPEGASWVGALHLSGNVWEWCSTLYDDFSYPYQEDDERDNLSIIDKRRVLRGGSWYSYADFLRAAIRSGDEPSLQNNNLGFRCARFLDS
ncbi:MAG: formylglycine-generating enzyme family protein, partial [Anaerolineae bacterium]|nr:formylglycine-generating enzyme family protein [Anaerolineae bacterium]